MKAETRIVLVSLALVLCSFLLGGFCLESPSAMMVNTAEFRASRGENAEAVARRKKPLKGFQIPNLFSGPYAGPPYGKCVVYTRIVGYFLI